METFFCRLFAVLVFGTNWSPLSGVSLGCHEDNVGNPSFYVIPAGYDAGQMTVGWCKAACRQDGYEFAGINDGKMCACSHDITTMTKRDDIMCTSVCSGGGPPTDDCGGPDSLYSIFGFGEGGGPMEGLSLEMGKETPTSDDVLDFTIGLSSGSDVSYTLDYGDSCPETTPNATGLTQHQYIVPGEYTATVTAQAHGLHQSLAASTAFQVGSLLSASPNLDCPPAELAQNISTCTVTFFRGQDVLLSADQGDGSGLQPIIVLDSPIFAIGASCVPQIKLTSSQMNPPSGDQPNPPNGGQPPNSPSGDQPNPPNGGQPPNSPPGGQPNPPPGGQPNPPNGGQPPNSPPGGQSNPPNGGQPPNSPPGGQPNPPMCQPNPPPGDQPNPPPGDQPNSPLGGQPNPPPGDQPNPKNGGQPPNSPPGGQPNSPPGDQPNAPTGDQPNPPTGGQPYPPGCVQPNPSMGQIIPRNNLVTQRSFITHFEMYATQAGTMVNIMIYRPQCTGSDPLCPESGKCSSICPEECSEYQPFDMSTGSCQAGGGPPTSASFPQYTPVGSPVPVTLNQEGYNLVTQQLPIEVLPGDIVTFSTGPGTLGYSEADGAEADETGDVNGGKTSTGKSYFFRALIATTTSFDIEHTYSKSGKYQFSVTLQNSLTPDIKKNTTPISVQEPVTGVRVFAVPQFVEVKKPTTIQTTLETGSYFSILWDFGDEDTQSTDYEEIVPGTPFSQEHIYENEGVYDVSVNASNAFSAETDSCNVIVQWPVTTNWELNVSSKNLIPPGSVSATLKYVGDPSVLPTNVSAFISWGDLQLPDNITFDPKTDYREFQHKYQQSGTHAITVVLSNLISNERFTSDVSLMQVLILIKAEAYGKDKKTNKNKPGSGKHKNVFDSKKDIYLDVSYDGTLDGYIVEFENGTVLGRFPKEEGIHFIMDSDGVYNLKVYGYNSVEEKSNPLPVVIVISGALQHIFITDSREIIDKNETKPFYFTFDSFPEGICMFVEYGDNTPIETYGDKDWCKKNMSGGTFMGELTNPLNTTHIYEKRGIYDLSAKACIPSSCTAATFEFTITLLKCKPAPSAKIADSYTNPTDAKKFVRSKSVRIKTLSKINCDNPDVIIKRWWTIIKTDPVNLTAMEIIPIENVLGSWNKSTITIPKLYLEFGLYKLQYTTSVKNPPPPVSKFKKTKVKLDLPPPYQFSRFTFIEIVVSPLVPILIKGAMTEVIRGYGQEVDMEAAKLSFDPDYPDSNVFTVEWFCNRINSDIPNDTLQGAAPDFDKSNFVDVLPPTGNHTHEDQGGCFGTGPGFINYTESNWVLNTLSLYRKNMTYNITAVIRRDIRVVPAWLLIKVVNGMPPTIEVKCLNEDLCHATARGLLINPNYRLALKGLCDGDCPAEPIFNWSVVAVDMKQGLKKTPITGLEEYLMTDDAYGSEYAINETFFADRTEVGIFGFELQISGGEEVGQAGLFIRINAAPTGGKCSLELSPDNTRPEGVALFSLWMIKCWGWIDPDGNGITKYSYFVKQDTLDTANDTITWKFNLLFDTMAEAHVVLPCGEQTVSVDIYDELGAFVEFDVNTTTPELPPKEEFTAFKRSPWMKRVLASGDQYLFIQMIQAISSLDHCYPKPDTSHLSKEEIEQLEIKRIMEESEERSEMLEGMVESSSVESMDDMVIISNAVTSVLGTGENSDNKERDLAIGMIGKMDDVLNDTEVAAPEAMLDLTRNVLQVVGAVIEGDTETVKSGHINPSDLEHVDDMYYDTEVEDDFQMPDSRDDMLRNAIRDAQKEKSEEHVGIIDQVLGTIQEKMFNSMAVNEQMFTIDTKSTAAAFAVLGGNESIRETPELGEASFNLPNTCVLLNLTGDNCNDTLAVGISSITSVGIMNSFGKGLNLLANDTSTVKLEIFSAGDGQDTAKMEVGGLDDDPIDVTIPKTGGEAIEPALIVPRMKWFEHMVYHQVVIDKAGSSLSIEIGAVNGSSSYVLFFRKKKKPALGMYDFTVNLEREYNSDSENVYKLFFDSDQIGNSTGEYYLGVAQLLPEAAATEYIKGNNYTKEDITRNFTSNYTFLMYTSGCYYYDEFYNEWKGDGCKVFNATPSLTHCKCTHLTTFAGGFFVMPNTIDFAYVFANASFADNLTIYVTIIVTVVVYILLLIWARRKDKRDREKIGALPLPDNNPADKYFYEVLVFTGHARNASTESKVSFILSGDKDETDIRTFGVQPRKVFRRDGVDVFVMSVSRPLGQLQFLRIWHDNSGKGAFASWYLNYVMIRDVQTGEKFDFISDNWFAVEEDDGQIDRIIPVAGKEQLTEFGHLFNTTSRKNLSDGHIWFSVFLRPPRSRFTRSQRVSTCMALLYLSMLANCMWYGTVPDNPKANALKFGPFSIGLEQISIGFMSNIIIFPPSFLIVFLFRKSRPRKLRPSRIDQALSKQKAVSNAQAPSTSGTQRPTTNGGKPQAPLYKRPKRCTLPWWFKIVAWVLCYVCMGVSIFFLWAYGITFGNEKTKKWLTSLLLSFFMSILITQPIKVFFLAMLFSAICKNVNTDEDDADEDEEDPSLHFDEEWLLAAANDPTKPRKSGYKPTINEADVEEARINRMKEVKMFQILKELFGYFIFLWILATVGYSSRDPNSFFLRKTLVDSFIEQRIPGVGKFQHITTEKDFWNWANNVLLPNIRFTRTYSNEPPFGMKGFLKDGVNRMLGFGILRQVRMRPGECELPPQFQNMSSRCSGSFTNVVHEDRTNYYDVGWKKLTKAALDKRAKAAHSYEEEVKKFGPWTYTKSKDIQGNPTVTTMGIYSGGGYIMELRNGSIPEIRKRLHDLERHNWIDRFTRAVFAEFSIFNAQANMFGIVQMYLEFVPGGGIMGDFKINTLTNIKYDEGLGKFLLVIQILFVVCIIYFTVRELMKMCREGCRVYVRSFWTWIEISILLTSYAALAAFIIRMIVVQKAVALFNETKGNRYINLQYPHLVDDFFAYCIAIVVFFAMMKFIKMLRFNNRMSALSKTLMLCAKDLSGFAVFFAVIFMAFGQLFYIFFSMHLLHFQSYLSTIESMFSIMLNRFDYKAFAMAQPFVGPGLFFIFALWSNIILINIFLSIIIISFETIKDDVMKKPNEYDIMDFVVRRFKATFGFGSSGARPKPKNLNAEKDEEVNGATKELPQKVDRLLEHINTVYFEGKLDLQSKEFLKRKHGKRSQFSNHDRRKAGEPLIFQSN